MVSKFKLKYFLYFVLVLYMGYLALSVFQIRELMDYDRTTLSVARDRSRDIRSRITEQQNIIPGLLSSPALPYSGIEVELERQESNRQRILKLLKDNYPEQGREMTGLLEAFRQYRIQVRKLASRLEENDSFDKASHSFNLELMPYIRNIISYINEIDITLDYIAAENNKKIHFRMNLLFFLSLVAGCLILLILIIADKRENAKNQEIAYNEKLFNQLSQNVDEVFIVASSPADFVYVSPNSKKLLGIDSKQLLLNPEELYDLIPDKQISHWLHNTLANEKPGQEMSEEDIFIPTLNKSFRLRIYPIGIISGNNERYIVSFSDQTKSLRHQEALKVALENAHAASDAKSSFLSHMSHEIRTPMNAIIGMTTIALTKINDKKRVEDCLFKISESSRHLLGIINDVLDMSKIESGKLSINYEQFNLMDNIAHIRNITQPQATAKKLKFDINLDNVENEILIGDSLRLNQVLLNLLSNACKFTNEGGVIALRIKEISKTKANAHFRFIVEDNGIGMAKEFLSRLYAPFEQASASTASRYGGTGLGMPITSNIVSLMGGTIAVESELNKGTKFTVELPFGIGISTNDPHNKELSELKVLIVDDDPGTCEHATLLLSKMGLKTTSVLNGAEAIETIRNAHESGNDYDICLIDWKMPDMDGAETARRIREIVGDEVLIIIISAFDLTEIKEDVKKFGVNDFIAKPFFSSTLYDVLLSSSRKLAQSDSHRENATQKPDFSGKRVLLAEDNEFNREIGQEFLELVNAEVDNAENGKEALEKLLQAPTGYYDLVLMDIQMPVMDGYEAVKRYRASTHPDASTLPIIAMTANAFSEDVAKTSSAGMNGHIAKPIDLNALYKTLSGYLLKKS